MVASDVASRGDVYVSVVALHLLTSSETLNVAVKFHCKSAIFLTLSVAIFSATMSENALSGEACGVGPAGSVRGAAGQGREVGRVSESFLRHVGSCRPSSVWRMGRCGEGIERRLPTVDSNWHIVT